MAVNISSSLNRKSFLSASDSFLYTKSNKNVTKQKEKCSYVQLCVFNNWIKSMIISEICYKNDIILDVGGGKGVDFWKWKVENVQSVVMIDKSKSNIEDAIHRYNQSGMKSIFSLECLCIDFCEENLFQNLRDQEMKFDVVSCQFILHYAFESEKKLRNFFHNISSKMKKESHIIATVPNSKVILEKMNSEGKIKNAAMEMIIDRSDLSHNNLNFGNGYILKFGNYDESIKEYLIDNDILDRIALEYKFQLKKRQSFLEYYREKSKYEMSSRLLYLMSKMDTSNGFKMMEYEWEIAEMYDVIVFEKIDD